MTTKQLKKYEGKWVIIEWLDPQLHGGWQDKPENCEPLPSISAGTLHFTQKGHIRLSGTLSTDQKHHADVTAYPVGCITKVLKCF